MKSFLLQRARGQTPFSDLRTRRRVTEQFLIRSEEVCSGLSAFTKRTLFKINRLAPPTPLDFTDPEWSLISRLRACESATIHENFLELAIDYVLANQDHLENLRALAQTVDSGVLQGDGERIGEALEATDNISKRSLYCYNVYTAIHAQTHSIIVDHFTTTPTSRWTRLRFVYPLIHYAVNTPTDNNVETFLRHLFPAEGDDAVERATVRFLLIGDPDLKEGLAFKCYIALLTHPFDALEIVTRHFETAYCLRWPISPRADRLIARLAAAAPWSRLTTLTSLMRRRATAYAIAPGRWPALIPLGLDPTNEAVLCSFLDLTSAAPSESVREALPPALAALAQMRWSRYPDKKQFEEAYITARRFGFTEAGRLIQVLMTGLYMLQRESATKELPHLLRLFYFTGVTSPFLYSSPRGALALERGLFPSATSHQAQQGHTDAALARVNAAHGRAWIKAEHWRLQPLERGLRIREWMSAVRAAFPVWVTSRFLSGVSWPWFDEVRSKSKLSPFAGSPDAVYTTLLRSAEEQRVPDYFQFRVLLPVANEFGSVEALVGWASAEFGPASRAFVRLILDPGTLLRLRLATSYTEALSERVNALEYVVGKYKFDDDIISEADLAKEQQALTSALTMVQLGAKQFETSWSSLKDHVFAQNIDVFDTYRALAETYRRAPKILEASKPLPYRFFNGRVASYAVSNRDWPLAMVICSIVDTFLSHPAFGIEAILSTRIRHDNLRREFADTIDDVASHQMGFLVAKRRKELMAEFRAGVETALQAWIDRYMHTGDASEPPAIFEFVLTPVQLEVLLVRYRAGGTLEEVVDDVLEGLRRRLDGHLEVAREKVAVELAGNIEVAVEKTRGEILARGWPNPIEPRRAAEILGSELARKCESLQEWFAIPPERGDDRLTMHQLVLAVQQRFRSEVADGRLRIVIGCPELLAIAFAREQIRPAYDLLTELVRNALKHGGRDRTLLHLSRAPTNALISLICRSLTQRQKRSQETVGGHPYQSQNEALFGDRKSGLQKIAHLSASLVQTPVSIVVARSKFGFHVIVPIATGEVDQVTE